MSCNHIHSSLFQLILRRIILTLGNKLLNFKKGTSAPPNESQVGALVPFCPPLPSLPRLAMVNFGKYVTMYLNSLAQVLVIWDVY